MKSIFDLYGSAMAPMALQDDEKEVIEVLSDFLV